MLRPESGSIFCSSKLNTLAYIIGNHIFHPHQPLLHHEKQKQLLNLFSNVDRHEYHVHFMVHVQLVRSTRGDLSRNNPLPWVYLEPPIF